MRLRDTVKQEKGVARKACFGILATEEFKDSLACEGLTDEDVWSFFKAHYKVDSRKRFGRVAWTTLANGLSIAQNNPDHFENLARKVWRYKVSAKYKGIKYE